MVTRGDLIIVALSGDYRKPRPALVIQSDDYDGESVTILPVTGDLHEGRFVRIDAPPSIEAGLHKPSQVMVDKILTVPRSKIGKRIGALDAKTLAEVERVLTSFLGLSPI